tara:strand:- start:538 stop:897 length:360 start_codon:yes stop_codon:yes gene_type:complete
MAKERWKVTGGGELTRGGIYYSSIKPQGVQDTLRFEPESWKIFNEASNVYTTNEKVKKAQDILVRMGYLEEKFADERLNRPTQGAIKRYKYNFSKDTMPAPTGEEIWEAIKDRLWFGND